MNFYGKKYIFIRDIKTTPSKFFEFSPPLQKRGIMPIQKSYFDINMEIIK